MQLGAVLLKMLQPLSRKCTANSLVLLYRALAAQLAHHMLPTLAEALNASSSRGTPPKPVLSCNVWLTNFASQNHVPCAAMAPWNCMCSAWFLQCTSLLS